MRVLENIRFYWDNIKRFEKNQLFYLILDRIKARFAVTIGHFKLKSIKNTDLVPLKLFKTNFCDTLCLENGEMIWDLFDSEKTQDIQYFTELKSNLSRNLDSPEKLWLIQHKDLEVSNNYDRFYLFAEGFVELKLPSDYVVAILKNFIELNHKISGKCWNGFNITIRIINWLKIFHHYVDFLTEEQWIIIQKSLYTHYILLKNRIEKHIPGNHILYQYFVLWLVSRLFPNWEQDKEWNEYIVEEIDKQFLPGGLHFELGYHYHIQTTIVVLYWLLVNQRSGSNVPDHIIETVKKAIEIIKKFVLPDGTLPMIGDNCFCFFHQNLKEDIKNIEKISSELFDSLNAFPNFLSNISDNYLISEFSDSKFILDVGELGYKSNPGHGHSDLLGFLYYQRAPVFIDPGTSTYRNSQKSTLLKKSVLHNTLTINSESQADLGSFFRWAYLPDNIKYNYADNENEHILSGSYRGFKKIGPFEHYRKVVHKNNYLEIEDKVPGDNRVNIELNFILHPDIRISKKEGFLTLNNQKYTWTMKFLSPKEYSINIFPVDIFPSYNQGYPSYRINLLFIDIELPFNCKTILFPE